MIFRKQAGSVLLVVAYHCRNTMSLMTHSLIPCCGPCIQTADVSLFIAFFRRTASDDRGFEGHHGEGSREGRKQGPS